MALFLLAIVVRIAAVFAVGSYRLDRTTYEHGEIARNLVEGRGFTVRWLGAEGPTSQQSPVYPALVAGFYWSFGVQTPAALLALQIFQAFLGGLLAVSVFLYAQELLPRDPLSPWLGALGVACYPTLVYAATQVQVATLVSLLAVVVLWLAARASRTNRILDAIGCGISSGLLVLTDPIMVLVVFVGLAMLVWRSRRELVAWCVRRAGVLGSQTVLSFLAAGVVLSACTAVVAPWIVRNYLVHGELVFVKSTFGYAFWQGNHPSSFGTDKIPLPMSSPQETQKGWGLRGLEQALWRTRLVDTLYIDDAVLSNEQVTRLGRLTEPERSRQLWVEATAIIGDNPLHYIRLCLQRLRYFLLFDETNPKSRVLLYRASHLALQGLAIAGLWVSRSYWRRLLPTYVAFGVVTAFHSLTIVSARFHLPLEPLEWIWAGCACTYLLETARRLVARFGRERGSRDLVVEGSPDTLSTNTSSASGRCQPAGVA